MLTVFVMLMTIPVWKIHTSCIDVRTCILATFFYLRLRNTCFVAYVHVKTVCWTQMRESFPMKFTFWEHKILLDAESVIFQSCALYQVRNPLDYRLIFREPSGCEPSQCRIFIGIDTNTGNNSFLDIYMEGEASGWIAVGFSDTQSMVSHDGWYVYLCYDCISQLFPKMRFQDALCMLIDVWFDELL